VDTVQCGGKPSCAFLLNVNITYKTKPALSMLIINLADPLKTNSPGLPINFIVLKLKLCKWQRTRNICSYDQCICKQITASSN